MYKVKDKHFKDQNYYPTCYPTYKTKKIEFNLKLYIVFVF